MFFSATCVAVLGFTSFTSAHMLLAKPPPFAGLHNGPLDGAGADYPCQLKFDGTAATTMPLGSTQSLEFTGSAVHGGGSCQISITYDDPPTKDSIFKVIHSIEGGCPAKNAAGNLGGPASTSDPDTYSFTMPTNLPTGKAVLAWTWFNKVGNREMYMNCAPIDITAGSSKRDNFVRDIRHLKRDQAAYIALPDILKANILNIGADHCGTNETFDITFPNPGTSVDRPGLQANYHAPYGDCNAASPPTGSGSSGSPGSGSGSSSIVSDPPAASTSAPAQGGVFVTTAAAATTLATSATAASVPASSSAPAASPSESPAPSPGGSGGSGGAGAMTAGSACSPEGLWNCVGGTSFQQCASGTWSVIQSLAAGTQCTPGQSAAINIVASKAKRAVRFSSDHVRRHVQRSAET